MTTDQKISAKILALMAEGMDAREALDAVCGPGTFKRLAGDVWKALQDK
jgi:hypothetical protein